MRVLIFSFVLFLSGCVTYYTPVEPDYKGATATIDDTFRRQSRGEAMFFYVEAIDGKPIINAAMQSGGTSTGRGSQLVTTGSSRKIPTAPMRVTLVASVQHAAPIGAMLNAGENYVVRGDIEFLPKANTAYVVNGTLSAGYKAVWIEDISGEVVTSRIEEGSPNAAADSTTHSSERTLTREQQFLSVSSGESVALVVARLGEPDTMTETKSNALTGRLASTRFDYEDLGAIEFSNIAPRPLYVSRVIPIVKEGSVTESSVREQIAVSDPQTLQQLAKGYYNAGITDRDTLDVLAQMLWDRKGTEDRYLIDTLAWFCKVIGRSTDGRYALVLEKLATDANSRKLRDYAEANRNLLSSTEEDAFSPWASNNNQR